MRAVRRLAGDETPSHPTDAQRLDVIADAFVAKCVLGDIPAIKEMGDRLDGKPTQPIAGDDDEPPVSLRIERVIVRPSQAGS